MGDFLDKSGVSTLWKRIKNNFDEVLVFEGGTTTYKELANALADGKLIASEDYLGGPAVSALDTGSYVELWFWSGLVDNSLVFTKVTVPDTEDASYSEVQVDLQEHVKERLDVRYNSTTKRLYLALDGTEFGSGIDASPFVKDGMLSDTSIIEVTSSDTSLISAGYSAGEKLIKFTWNTDGGGKVDYLRVTDIAPQPWVFYAVSSSGSNDAATVQGLRNALFAAFGQRKRLLIGLDSGVPTHEAYNIQKISATDGYSFQFDGIEAVGPNSAPEGMQINSYYVEVSHTEYTVRVLRKSLLDGGDGLRYLGDDGGYHNLVYTLDLTGADPDISDGNITAAKRAALADAVQSGRRIWVKTGYGDGMAMLSNAVDEAIGDDADDMRSVYLTVMIQPTTRVYATPKMYSVIVFYDNICVVEPITSSGSGAFLNDRMGFSVPESTFKIAKKSVADDGTITLDKTFAQIQAAIQQKKVILLEWDMDCIMTSAIDETSQCYMTFISLVPTGDDAALVYSVQLTVTSDEKVTATVSQVDIEPQSALSESDIDAAIAAAESE